jgi:hypothetical protein
MTHHPAIALAETIHIPFAIRRQAAELYWSLLEALLSQRDRHVALDRIEPDDAGGWYIHFRCDKAATITLLRDVAAKGCRPDDPLALLVS